MNKIDVKIKLLKEGHLPEYKDPLDSCADCRANIDEKVIVRAGEVKVIPLGFAMSLPHGWEAVVRPRSGLAARNGVVTIIGTIDEPYRKEVGCIFYNLSKEDFSIEPKDRICQMKIQPTYHACFEVVDKLDETNRGEGFGSSGIK